MKKYIVSFIVLFLFILNGCGGGSGSLKSGIGFIEALSPNAQFARATDDNANELINILVGYNTNTIIPKSRLIAKKKGLSIFKIAIKELDTFKSNKRSRLLNKCEEGSLNYITLNEYENKYEYRNCLQNGYYYNGDIIKKRVGNILEVKYITDFTIKNSDTYLKVYKGSSIRLENSGNYKITLNLVTYQNGKKRGFRNFEFIYNKNDNSIYYTQGFVYLNDLNEYAIYDDSYDMSATPLIYNENNDIEYGEFYFLFKNYRLHVTIDDGVVDYEWLNY